MHVDFDLHEARVSNLVANDPGSTIFAHVLDNIATPTDLLRVLGRYIHFNSVFGSGVACLAGAVGARTDLFRDPSESITLANDRSVEVASEIFYAAIDEFGDHSSGKRCTHRSLAQATLKGIATFYSFRVEELNSSELINAATLSAMSQVRRGYGLDQSFDQEKIFNAIGFHLGSETLASREFHILDQHMRTEYPDLVDWLEHSEVAVNGFRLPSYVWIRIHSKVEEDHAKAAVAAANKAIRYYALSENTKQLKDWIAAGFVQFSTVQTEFMSGLLN